MARIGIIIMMVLPMVGGLVWTSYGDVITTNDIDSILDPHIFEGLGGGRYHKELYKVCDALYGKGTNEVDHLKRHMFHRLLELPVSTNTVRADEHLNSKRDWVVEFADKWWFNGALAEEEVLGMLASATGVCYVATNDLESAALLARERDRALGWSEGSTGSAKCTARPNILMWMNERNKRIGWNESVDKYRYKVVLAAIRRLNVLWKDMEEPKRVKKIRETVESFGLEMPDW